MLARFASIWLGKGTWQSEKDPPLVSFGGSLLDTSHAVVHMVPLPQQDACFFFSLLPSLFFLPSVMGPHTGEREGRGGEGGEEEEEEGTEGLIWRRGRKREKKRSNSCNMVAHTRWSGTL